ncbi:MAG: helix-turn-helix domain-containing protein [Spirochaetaceae bacterium]|nr:MAG: helix-turn-helix domain-containing protein [Spirochaetaceae bacterium]
MRYSSGMKAAIIKRILPPNGETISEVSRETGVATATIHYWKKQAAEGMLDLGDGEVRPRDRSPGEKFTLLLESKSVDGERHGEWLRSRGLHTEHLPLWEQELREIVSDKEKKQREELAELKRKNKELEKELQRKDKALAETAALLVLKKKAEAIWGDDEED